MKKHLLLIVLIFTGFALWAQTSTAPTVGDGSAGNPYQIATLANLYWLSQTPAKWDSNFIQTADIDASATSGWNSGAGWSSPIGNSTTNFGGHYNGNGHVISSLTINDPAVTYVGLFGYSNGTISRLQVTNVNIAAGTNAGGLVAYMTGGSIDSCGVTGSVSGNSYVGGLVGYMEGDSITYSYARCYVSGGSVDGGLAGLATGSIKYCNTTDSITATSAGTAGGLVGELIPGGSLTVTNCYAAGKVSGGSFNGGLVGEILSGGAVFNNCIYNSDYTSSPLGLNAGTVSGGPIGASTAILQTENLFTTSSWDFQGETANGTADIWGISPVVNGGFPFLSWQGYSNYAVIPAGSGTSSAPYQIATLNNLYWLSQTESVWQSGSYFSQTADIDAGSTKNWNSGLGFPPIAQSIVLTGDYNGQGHIIDSLFINRPSVSDVGLIAKGSGLVVDSLGLPHVHILGSWYVGGIEGYSITGGSIANSYVSGSITGSRYVGGIEGSSGTGGSIANSYVAGSITGSRYVGGIKGYSSGGSITDSYATGSITGDTISGGIEGYSSGESITNSYATGSITGDTISGGIEGYSGGGSITNCYSTASVSDSSYAGGLVGEIGSGTTLNLTDSYATGGIAAIKDTLVGGLAGKNLGTLTSTSSFWNSDTISKGIGNGTVTGATGEPTAAMKTESTYTNAGWDFTNTWAMNSGVNSGYPFFLLGHSYSWTGATSTDWNTASNWYCDTVPTTQDAYINQGATNLPIIGADSNALASNIVVDNSATLTVATGSGLIVSDSLINDGTFTLESDATGNGSLIVAGGVGGTGTFIRQQYIPDNDTWHMIASPSQNEVIVGSDFVPSAPLPGDFDFYSFDQSSASPWVNINASGSVNSSFETDFIPGKGYLAAYTPKYGKTTVDFTGPFNTGDVTPPALAYTSGATHAGWNLIGNPYTSAIDWNKAVRTDFSDNYAYVYDPNKSGGAGYDDVDGSTVEAYIAPGQAFFVHVNAAPSTAFQFTSSMQVNEPTVTLKSAEATQGSNQLVLRLSSKSHYDETTLQVVDGTKSTRDRDDALELLSLDDSIPQIYSNTSDSVAVAINSYPSIDSIFTVQLGTYIPFQGTYTISLQQHDGDFANIPIVLKDLSTGTKTDLTNGSYTFTGNKTDVRRFVLTINGTTGINKNSVSSGIQVYGYHSSIYIQARDGSNLNGKVTVYNLMGEVVYHSTLNDTPSQVLNLQTGNGMYIVELNLKTGTRIVDKVVLEQ